MNREFYFPSALVTQEADFVRVRFWARKDKDTLQITGNDPKAYLDGAQIVLQVSGASGTPSFPPLNAGSELYDEPFIEVQFKGKCIARKVPRSGGTGLRVTVDGGSCEVLDGTGLPFDPSDVAAAANVTLGGICTSADDQPHGPPIPPAGSN
ncbi:hypothetical protein [Vulgatibacter sp.]|uniref:hypothetical protein n=1 Tax=Vulgatibacter sp. TaxID=1971226 RepID=UPI0035616694